ncbi:MAG: long-chain-acyl-CoA synthetase [Nevskiales bacterium]
MNPTGDIIRFGDLARGILRALPDSSGFRTGLRNLATFKPDTRASIGWLLERQAQQYADRPALLFENRRWTYAEFNAWVNRLAGVFRKHGVGPGDAVAILMENRPEVLACVSAVVKLGAVAGMLNHNQRGEVLAHSIALTKAKLIVVGEECIGALESTGYMPGSGKLGSWLWDGVGTLPEGYLNLHSEAEDMSSSNPPETQAVQLKNPCFYIFTSGTTGLPKASVMTHYRWLRGMAGLGQMALRLKPQDVFYCCLPLYHNNALTVSWSSALGTGSALALSRKFSASRFWDEIRHHDATAFCYIGELCRYLLNQPATKRDREHRVRIVVGNGLRPEIWDDFQQRFGIAHIAEFYGASESNLAFVNGFGLSRTAGFCPLPYAVVEFDAEHEQPARGPDGLMRKVAKGGVGLLICQITPRAPFDGYTDQKASEAKLFHDVFKPGDHWYNSGDLVRDQGFKHIQFIDRVGDTFRWKGENVATTEVEGALNQHAEVEQAVVYGVQIQGCDGRAGMAALTWRGKKFDGAGLAGLLCSQLPAYAVPLFIRLREEQEITGTFKYRKVELKKEGFDPGKVAEPLYILLDTKRGYEPLTADIFRKIGNGIRF